MTITGVFGEIGSGKSWFQMQYALSMCEKKEKILVTNFALNLDGLYKYCKVKNYEFIVRQMDKGGIIYIDPNSSLGDILKIGQSIVCLDEAGIFLNSRAFMSTPRELLADLCQSRKFGADLIYAAQFVGQVDRQMRDLTQFVIHCSGTTVYNKKERRPELKLKNYHVFTRTTYERWIESKAQFNPIKTRFAYAMHSNTGPMSIADIMLFAAFDSLQRIDNGIGGKKRIDSIQYSRGKYEKRKFEETEEETETYLNIKTISADTLTKTGGQGLLSQEKEEEETGFIEDKKELLKEEIRADLEGIEGQKNKKNKKSLGTTKEITETAIETIIEQEENKKQTKQKKPKEKESAAFILYISTGQYSELITKWNNNHITTRLDRLIKNKLPKDAEQGFIKIKLLLIRIRNEIVLLTYSKKEREKWREKIKETRNKRKEKLLYQK